MNTPPDTSTHLAQNYKCNITISIERCYNDTTQQHFKPPRLKLTYRQPALLSLSLWFTHRLTEYLLLYESHIAPL